MTEAEYIPTRGGLVAAGVSRDNPARAGIRLRLRHSEGNRIAELPMDSIVLHMTARERTLDPARGVGDQCHGMVGRSTDRRDDWFEVLRTGRSRPVGLDPDEALLPTPRRSFDGYRLLQEYFAMPQRFHFVELSGLRPALARAKGPDVDIYIL